MKCFFCLFTNLAKRSFIYPHKQEFFLSICNGKCMIHFLCATVVRGGSVHSNGLSCAQTVCFGLMVLTGRSKNSFNSVPFLFYIHVHTVLCSRGLLAFQAGLVQGQGMNCSSSSRCVFVCVHWALGTQTCVQWALLSSEWAYLCSKQEDCLLGGGICVLSRKILYRVSAMFECLRGGHICGIVVPYYMTLSGHVRDCVSVCLCMSACFGLVVIRFLKPFLVVLANNHLTMHNSRQAFSVRVCFSSGIRLWCATH